MSPKLSQLLTTDKLLTSKRLIGSTPKYTSLCVGITSNDTSQLLLRLEGNGGTGKTHVVNAWCNLMEPSEFVVAAPTGRASQQLLYNGYIKITVIVYL
jgi:hypothetical protein